MEIKLGTRVGLLNNRGCTGTVMGVREADQNTFYQVIIDHTYNCKEWFHPKHSLPILRDPEIYLCPEDELIILSNPPEDVNNTYKFSYNHLTPTPLRPKKVIFSGPKTIVIWNDDTKTIVSQSDNDIYDEYGAFCAAVTKKIFGSTRHAKKVLDETTSEPPKKGSKNEEKSFEDITRDFHNDLIAAGLFAIAAEISAHKDTKKEEE